jgi:hypothetical protein
LKYSVPAPKSFSGEAALPKENFQPSLRLVVWAAALQQRTAAARDRIILLIPTNIPINTQKIIIFAD